MGESFERSLGSRESEFRDSSFSGSESMEDEWLTFLRNKKTKLVKTGFNDGAI